MESSASAIQEIELEDGWFEARPPQGGEESQVQDMDIMDNMISVVGGIDRGNTGGAVQGNNDDDVADMDEDMADMDADMEQH